MKISNVSVISGILLSSMLMVLLSLDVFGQWQPTSGPVSGHIRTFLNHGPDLYVGSGGGGIIKTNDYGNTWTSQNAQIGSTDIKALVSLNNKIFAGTDEGVFVSEDGGASWTKSALMHTYVKALTVKDSILFAGTYVKGMFRSTDEGNSWQQVNTSLPDLYIYCLACKNDVVFAGTYQHGIYVSYDNGDSWAAANTGVPEMTIMSLTLAGNRLFAGTLSHGVYYSDDDGAHWTAIPTLTGHTKAIAVLGDTLFAGTSAGVFRSEDLGASWTSMNNGLTETSIWGMGKADNVVFAGTASGKVFRSIDYGNTWSCTNNSMVFKAVVGSIVKSANNLLCASHGSGLFRTTDNGDSYIKDNSIGTVEIRSLGTMGTPVYAGTDLLGIFRSDNHGVSFTATNNGLNSTWVQSIAVNGSTVFAGTGEAGVFRSDNNGINWVAVNDGLGSVDITALLYDDNNIYAGTYDAGVYVSADNGLHWTAFNNGLTSVRINCLTVINGYLYCGTDDSGIFTYSFWDQIWNPESLGLPANASVRAITNYGSTKIAATSDNGVYVYMDTGTWEPFNFGLTNTQIRSLYVDDIYLFAGTDGGGVFRRPLVDISIGVKELSETMKGMIFPNPAATNSVLHIKFITIPATVEIYNAAGSKIIETRITETLKELDTNTLKPGIYFIRIINRVNETKQKLIIL